MKKICFEIVKWKSKAGVSDEAMINAVDDMVADLKTCNGFIEQTLYKNKNNEWVDNYYWKGEACAHASNAYMAEKDSFSALVALIDPESVSLEILLPVQSSVTAVSIENA